MRRSITSAEGRTSCMRQPLVAPTSIYSMKRSTTPECRKCWAMGTISPSLVPRLTTMLTLIGASPTFCAISRPLSTSVTGKSTLFMRRKMASSRASRLTVTRCSPAFFNDWAFFASNDPLVVSVMSSGAPAGVCSLASISISTSRFLRSRGSPPVSRIFSTPWATKIFVSRVISSKLKSEVCGRKA